MKSAKNNYARFYALIKNIPGDHDELKVNLVRAFTNGRTTSLREMYPDEFKKMCDSIDTQSGKLSRNEFEDKLRKKRSAVLVRLDQLNLRDWAARDNFLLQPRIAGKAFRHLTIPELEALIPKLEAIIRKPRREPAPDPIPDPLFYTHISEITRNQIPS